MSDAPTRLIEDPAPRVLTRTSVCEISSSGDEVTLKIGKLSLSLTPLELAALSGSCRGATRKLFRRRPKADEVPYLRLVEAADDLP